MKTRELTFLEFFAGGGMARIGLGDNWRCLFANDFDPAKRDAYHANFGLGDHFSADINALDLADLPAATADLAWASSPCQDLSLAGGRGGLKGERSGAFFGFWRVIEQLDDAGRAPRIIAIENVTGLLTSNAGADFNGIVALLAARGYTPTALVINASHFLPQSRPRLFIIGVRNAAQLSPLMTANARPDEFTPASLLAAVASLDPQLRRSWRWLAPRPPHGRNCSLADIIDKQAPCDDSAATARLLAAMSPRQRAAIDALVKSGGRHVGAAFRRVRLENSKKTLRIEARFDGLAGCVRTPAGGSSRQIILIVENGSVRSRLMTPREAARAMGLPDDYKLPEKSTAALKLIGDGVAPPVVRWLADEIFQPALSARRIAA